MNQFAAPRAEESVELELDPAAAVPGLIVKLGAVALGVAAFFTVAAGLQLFTFFYLTWAQTAVGVLQVVGGGVAGLLAPFVLKGRSWAAVLGTLSAGGLVLLCVPWSLYTLFSGLFSPLLLLGTGFICLSAALMPFTIVPAIRATAARKALYA